MLCVRRVHGGAQIAGRMVDHEGGEGRRQVCGGDEQVAFIFTRGRIEDDEEFAVSWED